MEPADIHCMKKTLQFFHIFSFVFQKKESHTGCNDLWVSKLQMTDFSVLGDCPFKKKRVPVNVKLYFIPKLFCSKTS